MSPQTDFLATGQKAASSATNDIGVQGLPGIYVIAAPLESATAS